MAALLYIIRKLRVKRVWARIFIERLTEPIHLNVLACLVWLFGSYKRKVDFDLVHRPQHAFGIYRAAVAAAERGFDTVTLIEFGVASGSGLMNMAYIAQRVTAETGIHFKLFGFDTGRGMPAAIDYRDHPEYYQAGDFQTDLGCLQRALPHFAHLVIGDLRDTLAPFVRTLSDSEPIGFVAIDLDYYSSTREALTLFAGPPTAYLPTTFVYFDDIKLEGHNSWAGELLAIREFNRDNELRKLEHHRFLADSRVFGNASWLKQMYFLHVMDHPVRSLVRETTNKRYIENAYLEPPGKKERFVV